MENIIVIGLGSMGKRRIRLIGKIKNDVHIIGVDGREDRRIEALDMCNGYKIDIETVSSMEDIPLETKIYAAFICTSPISHGQIISQCEKRGYNVFTEINLIRDLYEDNIKSAKKNGKVLYLSSTPMFRKEIQFIRDNVKVSRNLNYIFHVGQYLPDWHPWESYKDFFISDSRTNGCREIMAIEFPWLIDCFGKISHIEVSTSRQTKLDINFNDSYNIIIEHENGNRGVFIVDVVCRFPVRYFEVSGEDLFITWNGKADGLKKYNLEKKELETVDLYSTVHHNDGYNVMIIENAYEEELKDFFEVLEGTKKALYTFEDDLETLRLIDGVENVKNR